MIGVTSAGEAGSAIGVSIIDSNILIEVRALQYPARIIYKERPAGAGNIRQPERAAD